MHNMTTPEELRCPSNSKRKDVGAGYRSFIENVSEFNSLEDLPVALNKALLENRIEATLNKKKASWHKTCRYTFNNTKLKRAQKRKREDTHEQSSPIKTRR